MAGTTSCPVFDPGNGKRAGPGHLTGLCKVQIAIMEFWFHSLARNDGRGGVDVLSEQEERLCGDQRSVPETGMHWNGFGGFICSLHLRGKKVKKVTSVYIIDKKGVFTDTAPGISPLPVILIL